LVFELLSGLLLGRRRWGFAQDSASVRRPTQPRGFVRRTGFQPVTGSELVHWFLSCWAACYWAGAGGDLLKITALLGDRPSHGDSYVEQASSLLRGAS